MSSAIFDLHSPTFFFLLPCKSSLILISWFYCSFKVPSFLSSLIHCYDLLVLLSKSMLQYYTCDWFCAWLQYTIKIPEKFTYLQSLWFFTCIKLITNIPLPSKLRKTATVSFRKSKQSHESKESVIYEHPFRQRIRYHLHWSKANAKKNFFDLCRCSMWTLIVCSHLPFTRSVFCLTLCQWWRAKKRTNPFCKKTGRFHWHNVKQKTGRFNKTARVNRP